ncbi:MAG: N-6 DNA methylase [Alphaproteobacteria bacterium]|nr:N-6 DNA methylase [Alphaproteobacteria bacterium]
MSATELLQSYAHRVRELRRANADVPETALAPAFQQLLEGLIPLLPIAPRLIVVPEFRNPGVGRPDIALVREGAPPRAFVELKAPTKPADPARWRDHHDRRQFERFQELSCWATCNFYEVRLFFRGEEQGSATVVPEQCLRPDRSDARADRTIAAHDSAPFLRLIEILCTAAGTEPAARDAEHLAMLMAHSARLVRGIVRDRLTELHEAGDQRHALLQVRQEFRDVLYAHPEAAGYTARDFNDLFSAAFAQTLAFGLLLVREATGQAVERNAWQRMPEEHPLMRTALRVLSLEEVEQDIGIGFVVMRDTVNSFAPKLLAIRPDGRDPILYFYEDFLRTFDPEARERFGVYYTPVEVVQHMVGALDRALRDNLQTQGLRDPTVTILDPAAGTGTFLLGVAQRVRDQETAGAGMAALALQDLAHRMFGFELLVGPYAVAHYRLHHALRRREEGGEEQQLPRLGVYLTDTLARPNAAAPMGPLGFVSEGIAEEHREANRIKSQQEILAIIGNPPYRRLEEGENRTLVGDWMDDLWDDLKEPVRSAGYGNQLNTFPELSVAFWRWAIWKLFEAENAPRRGVVAFITNRKFLTGWPYAGLRQMMRQRFDRIEIFDLRGDVRRGERAGVDADQGVFNIQVGTAITIAIADGSKQDGEAADVFYSDSWAEGLFSRRAKLDQLSARANSGDSPNAVAVRRGLLEDMRPKPFQNGEWFNLREVFKFSKSGMKSGDDPVFVSVVRSRLRDLVTPLLSGRADASYDTSLETYYSYRPLDRRWFFNDLKLLNRPGPTMQQVWGRDNVGLYAVPSGTGAGPGVWCHALIPDYHAFRGNYGGYAFPLHDRRTRIDAPNLVPALIEGLSTTYGEAVAAVDIFDAILCTLSARTYTLRFAEDLEDTFPHVAFPTQHTVFQDAVRLGREIRAVETFARDPAEAYRQPDFMRVETEPRGEVASVDLIGETLTLCEDGSGRITGLPQGVWNFSVSGYRVLPRWLEARIGLPADLAFVRELRDICGRIAELIDLFAQADIVLDATLHESLSREALNFTHRHPEANDGSD